MKNNPKLQLFAEWLALDEAERSQIEEWAKVNGVPLSTAYRWQTKLTQEPGEDEVDRFLQHVKKQALTGRNPKWAELYMKAAGMLDKPIQKATELDGVALAKQMIRAIGELEDEGFKTGRCFLCGHPITNEKEVVKDRRDVSTLLDNPGGEPAADTGQNESKVPGSLLEMRGEG